MAEELCLSLIAARAYIVCTRKFAIYYAALCIILVFYISILFIFVHVLMAFRARDSLNDINLKCIVSHIMYILDI